MGGDRNDADSLRSLARDRATTAIATGYVLLGAANASLGPVSEELRRSLHLSGTLTGLHGAMFGWFLLASGLGSTWLSRRPPGSVFRSAVVAMGAGLVVLAGGHHVGITLLGAAGAGAGGAAMVFVTPQLVNARHGARARVGAFTYINALSQAGSLAAPLLLAFALGHGFGWRWVLGAIGVVGGAAAMRSAWRRPIASVSSDAAPPIGERTGVGDGGWPPAHLARNRTLRRRWCVLTLGISIEFALLFWGASAIRELAHATSAAGALGVSLFAAGMIAVRMLRPWLATLAREVVVLRVSFVATAVCTVVLRFGPGLVVRLGALGLAGASLALVYPTAFARQYGVGLADDGIGPVGALASGTAVTFAPLALGALADATSLRAALAIVPALAIVALVLLAERGDAGSTGPGRRPHAARWRRRPD